MIITMIRRAFCKHDFILAHNASIVDPDSPDKVPSAHLKVYFCTKCGLIRKVRT